MSTEAGRVSVTFVEESTGIVLGSMELPPESVADTVAPGRTVSFRNEEWLVLKANPTPTPLSSGATGFTLRVRRVQRSADTLPHYSQPTICSTRARPGDTLVGERDLLIRQNDWRQFEFVSSSFWYDVDEELSRIRVVHDTKWDGTGWKERHSRTRPAHPIDRMLTTDEIAGAVGVADPISGVAYSDSGKAILDGFSLQVDPGLSIYGLAPGSHVTVLALLHGSGSISQSTIDRLKRFAKRFGLDLVDWCRCIRTSPDSSLFDVLLSPQTVS